MDTSSQKSFISSEAVKRLNIPIANKVRLTINPFGGGSEYKEFDVIKIKVQIRECKEREKEEIKFFL